MSQATAARITVDEDSPKDPKRIWLGLKCQRCSDEGRMWCEDRMDCDDCGDVAIEYIRADLVEKLKD